ncbi:MAG: tetratricopeptide repeat protein [Thermodesulfobacteriota bacterium]
MYIILLILLLSSGCAGLQKQAFLKELDIPVPEIVEDEVDTQLDEETIKRINILFNDALARMEYAPQNAVKLYKEIIEIAPNLWESYYNLGVIYMRDYDTKKAIEEFISALRHKAPPAKIYNTLGIVYLDMGEKKTSINMFERVLSYEESPSAMINIANIYRSMDQTKKAIEYYREIGSIAPSDQLLYYNIGTLLYEMGDYKGAEEAFDKALTYGERSKSILHSQAQTLLRLKEYEEVFKVFQEIIEKEPIDPAFYRDMGIIYELYLGDMEKALENYTRYVENGGEKEEEVKIWIGVVKARLESLKEEEG